MRTWTGCDRIQMKLISSLLIVVALVFLLSNPTVAQWKQIGSFGNRTSCCWFFDGIPSARFGFVGVQGGALYRTIDGGLTWMTVIQPGVGYDISDITFKDSLTGWLAMWPYNVNDPLCYKTIDGGLTWAPQSITGIVSDAIWYNKQTNLLFLSVWEKGLMASSDGGGSWYVAFPNQAYEGGISFSTSQHGFRCASTGNSMLSGSLNTIDGGQSWNPVNFPYEATQPMGVSGSDTYFVVTDFWKSNAATGGFAYRSDDLGQSWKQISHIPVSDTASGCIRGSLCEMFTQSTFGMYLSTDEGISWSFIGGPTENCNDFIVRFYAHNGVVIAGDQYGNVYRLDSTFRKPPLPDLQTNTSLMFPPLSLCKGSQDTLLAFSNYFDCDSVTILAIGIRGSSTAFTLPDTLQVPLTVAPHDSGVVRVRFNSASVGSQRDTLYITLSAGNQKRILIIPLSGSLINIASGNFSSSSISFDSISTCDSQTVTTYLKNTGCDSLLFSEFSAASSGDFHLLSPTNSVWVHAGDSVLVGVRFRPSGNESLQDSLYFRGQLSSGSSITLKLLLFATTSSGTSSITLPDTTINFGNISICSHETLPAYFISSGCDSLGVSGEALGGLNGFSVMNAHGGLLAIGAKDSVLLRFAPPTVGPFSDTLFLSTTAGVKKIYLFAEGTADQGNVVLSDTALSFGSVTASCDSSSASFRFTNGTCYAITLDSALSVLRQSPFVVATALGSQAGSPVLPVDSSVVIGLRFVPGSVGQFSGGVTVYYHGSDNIEHDTTIGLTATATSSPTIGVAMKSQAYAASALGTIDIPIYLTGALDTASSKRIGITSIAMIFAMNTDLLTPLTAIPAIANIPQIPVQTTKNAATLTVSLPPNLTFTDSTLLMTLHCQAFVTDTMQTAITLTNATFTSQNANACFAQSASITSSTFALIASCEDSVLTGDLAHGLAFTIESIVPNPTDGKVTVMLLRSTDCAIRYELCDVLGDVVASGLLGQGQPPPLLASANPRLAPANQRLQKAGEYYLNFGAVPSGSYYLRLSTQSQVESRRIILAR